MAEGQPPPSFARKALTVLVLLLRGLRASPIATHKPCAWRVDWDSGGAAKNWDSPPRSAIWRPRGGSREGGSLRAVGEIFLYHFFRGGLDESVLLAG